MAFRRFALLALLVSAALLVSFSAADGTAASRQTSGKGVFGGWSALFTRLPALFQPRRALWPIPNQQQQADECVQYLLNTPGYVTSGRLLNFSGVLYQVNMGVTFLAPTDAAWNKVPRKLKKYLSQPNATGRTITHIIKYNTLWTFKSFSQFVAAGSSQWNTLISGLIVQSTFYKNQLLFRSPLHPNTVATVVGRDLFYNQVCYIQGTSAVLLPDDGQLYYYPPSPYYYQPPSPYYYGGSGGASGSGGGH
jgi:hypothetical protein